MTSLEFISKNAIMRGNIALLSKEQTISLIELCKVENRTILGIDSFIVYPNAIQPISEESIDFTYTQNNKTDNWCAAQSFMKSKCDGKYYYEVVLK